MSEKIEANGKALHTLTDDELWRYANSRDSGKKRHKAQKELIRRGKLEAYFTPEK